MYGPCVRRSKPGNEFRYNTMCSSDPNTIIIRTDGVNGISDLVLNDGVGSVMLEAGRFSVLERDV
jgi:L-gulonolactone oxidase